MGALKEHIATSTAWLSEARARFTSAGGAQLMFEHHGYLDHAAVEKLLAVAEEMSIAQADPVGSRKRLFNVLVEALENSHRHTEEGHKGSIAAVCVADERGYRIGIANALPLATAALLTHRISILNEMDESDLKEYYLKVLSNQARSNGGGAGLGLLTIARKSSRPLIVGTLPLDEVTGFFTMELRVERESGKARTEH